MWRDTITLAARHKSAAGAQTHAKRGHPDALRNSVSQRGPTPEILVIIELQSEAQWNETSVLGTRING